MTSRTLRRWICILPFSMAGLVAAGALAARGDEPATAPPRAATAQRETTATTGTLAAKPPKLTPRQILERWGIETVALRPSAGGFILDYRFRVRDVDKSKPLFDSRAKPCIIDQKTGARFIVPAPPKVGQLRPTKNIEAGKIYFIIFANPGRYIKPGAKVTIEIGGFRAEDLVVQ